MSEALLSEGRVDHINMMMGLHPTYLTCFLRTHNALLQLDGPLPLSWRHFIIILVREETGTFRLQVLNTYNTVYVYNLHNSNFLCLCRRLHVTSARTWCSITALLFCWLVEMSPGFEDFTVHHPKYSTCRRSTNCLHTDPGSSPRNTYR